MPIRSNMITTVLILIFATAGCHNANADLSRFHSRFSQIQLEFNTGLSKAADRQAYIQLQQTRNRQLNELLREMPDNGKDERASVLRARILVNLERVSEAESLLEPLLKKADPPVEAAMVQVLAHMAAQRKDAALEVFRGVEARISDRDDRHNAWLYFAMMADDPAVQREYALKFTESSDLPAHFALFRANVYAQLARLDQSEQRYDKARSWLEKAMSATTDPAMRAALEDEKMRMELLGKSPAELAAEHWLNQSPLTLKGLKGKVVLIDFWAPWCKPCRMVTPDMIRLYRDLRGKGLEIIGFTRLYGFYRDDIQDKGRVEADEELRLIREYVRRNQIPYPIAVSREGQTFDTYRISGIPTLVLIDRSGRIATISVGAGHPDSLRRKIESLLENSHDRTDQ